MITGQTGDDPIFQGAADFDLELIESRTLDGHIQKLIYRPTLRLSPSHAPPPVKQANLTRGMASKPSERFVWAVDTPWRSTQPIACWRSAADTWPYRCLPAADRGRITAIDRSKKMIEMAARRNREHVAGGRAVLKTATALEKADFEDERFDHESSPSTSRPSGISQRRRWRSSAASRPRWSVLSLLGRSPRGPAELATWRTD